MVACHQTIWQSVLSPCQQAVPLVASHVALQPVSYFSFQSFKHKRFLLQEKQETSFFLNGSHCLAKFQNAGCT
jgi:hypothetical protein